jgi:hypothetical protein
MKKWGIALAALVLLLTPLVAAAAGPNPGTGNARIFAMNLDTGGQAHVVADFYNQAGTVAYSDSANVPFAGFASWDTQLTGLPSGWLGSAILSSDRPIAAVTHVKWTGGAGGDGITAAAYTGFSQGANEIYAPSLFKRTYQSSKITVQNTETGNASVTVAFYTRGNSTAVHTLTDTIPGGAQRTYDVWDYAAIPTAGPDPGTDNWVGAAKITSPQKVAVVVTTLWRWGSSVYPGVATPATKLYLPSIFKKKYANWQIYSGAIVMNPNSSTANLTMYFYNRDGTLAVTPVSQSIGPYASDGFNTRYDSGEGKHIFDAVSDDWNGLAIIESDVPVVGIVNIIWQQPSQMTGSYSMGTDANDASLKLAYPIMTRRYFGTWNQWSGAIFQNASASSATVTTTFYNSNGTVAASPPALTLPGHGAVGWNTRYDSEPAGAPLAGLPADWEGTVIVQSTQPIVGIMNNIWSNQTATYNAAKMP